MKWPIVKIRNLGMIVSGSTPKTNIEEYWNGPILWVTPKDLSALDNVFISTTNKTITKKGLNSCSTTILPAYSVLFSSRAPIGHIAINTVPMCTNQGFKSIIPDRNKADSTYLYYVLKSKKEYLKSIGNGATFKELSKETFLEVELPLPPLDDQIRIAAVLTRAEKLIAKRKESIKALDEFLKSTFLEMFGDPVRNEKRWERDSLKKLCGFITKGTTPKSKDIFDTFDIGLVPFIKVYHICNNGSINFNYNPTFIDQKIHNEYLKRSVVYPDDVLMNIVGPPLGKIGLVPKIFKEWNVNQAIAIFRCGVTLNPQYLLFMMKSSNFCDSIIKMAVGIRQLNLSLEQCREINIPVPPLPLQTQFASIVEKVEVMKAKYTQSLSEMEKLYGSLSQRAFKGELDLSRVPLEK